MKQKRPRILFANIPTPNNRFVVDLKEGLEQYADIDWDYQAFWAMDKKYDIIHIHWPEYLSFELESYLHKTSPMPNLLWQNLIQCLDFWKKNAHIIYTRHVQYPHSRHDQEFLRLYRTTVSYCSTVIHFGRYSIKQFKEFYPDLTSIKHVVIPHHNYESLPNHSNTIAARQKLGIDKDASVMLVFGAIKENEKKIIKSAFSYIPNKNKVLLAPGWKINRRKISYIRLRDWIWKFEKWIASQHKRYKFNLGFISEEQAHYFLNASDFLFIPRTNELNSGNITLGCTFGLVVVGKNSADIGEILLETGNPTFEVGNIESLKNSIQKALCLKENEHGRRNQEIAEKEWNVTEISKKYIDEINLLISSSKKSTV